MNEKINDVQYFKEYWSGDSRDGRLVNGDGYHFYKMSNEGAILEAFEVYELEDGTEVASELPEMLNINWFNDLGFEDLETLDKVPEGDFKRVSDLASAS